MKKWLLFSLGIGILILLPKPEYVELNHLIIVDTIEITCKNLNYQVTITEMIPKKEEDGIHYEKKQYKKKGKNLKIIKKELQKETTNKIYYKSLKKIKTNCKEKKELKKIFQ